MTGQLKQRIVGAVVLLFLAMIILPWLFTNNPSSLVTQKNIRKKEKIANSGFPEMLEESSPSAKPIPDKIETTELSAITNPKPPAKKIDDNLERITEMNSNKISTIENSIVHNTPEAEPPLLPSVQEKVKAKPLVKKFKTPDFEKTKSPLKTESKKVAVKNEKNWTVQLGSFSNKTNADKLVQQLKTKGYTTYLKTSKSANNVVTKVYVGLESERHAAEAMMKKIEKTLKIHGVISKVNP